MIKPKKNDSRGLILNKKTDGKSIVSETAKMSNLMRSVSQNTEMKSNANTSKASQIKISKKDFESTTTLTYRLSTTKITSSPMNQIRPMTYLLKRDAGETNIVQVSDIKRFENIRGKSRFIESTHARPILKGDSGKLIQIPAVSELSNTIIKKEDKSTNETKKSNLLRSVKHRLEEKSNLADTSKVIASQFTIIKAVTQTGVKFTNKTYRLSKKLVRSGSMTYLLMREHGVKETIKTQAVNFKEKIQSKVIEIKTAGAKGVIKKGGEVLNGSIRFSPKGLNSLKTLSRASGITSSIMQGEDTGSQVFSKSKDFIIGSKKAYVVTNKTIRFVKPIVKAASFASQSIFRGIRTLANPIILKGLGFFLLAALFLSAISGVVSGVASIFSSSSYSANVATINATTSYIQQLDQELKQKMESARSDPRWTDIDEFHLYGTPNTNASQILAFFSVKYQNNFSFEMIQEKLKTIHSSLYAISYSQWSGEDPADTGDSEDDAVPTETQHLNVTLEYNNFSSWLTTFTPDQMELYTAILEMETDTLPSGEQVVPITPGMFTVPTVGVKSSPYGPRGGRVHGGVDIANAATGVPVVAAADGVVSRSYTSSSYGECVFITHHIDGQLYTTVYAHMNPRMVTEGQTVVKGQQIGVMGNTGRSTGQHLHFEVYIGAWTPDHSNAVNPENYIQL